MNFREKQEEMEQSCLSPHAALSLKAKDGVDMRKSAVHELTFKEIGIEYFTQKLFDD